MVATTLAQTPLAYTLLIVTALSSLYALLVDESFGRGGLFAVGPVRAGEYHRMVTPAFLHADLGHLFVNMVTLYFFGPAVEQMYGTLGFLVLYVGSQLAAQGYTLWRKWDDAAYQALGASGAVSGVLMAFCLVEPTALLYLFFAIPIPAFVFAIGYLAYSTLAMGSGGRVAHEAHLGGAVGGLVLGVLLPAAG